MTVKDLAFAEEALSLPASERAGLAKLLVDSLEGEARSNDEIQADLQNRLNRLRQIQPILQAKRRIFFVFPKKIAGEDTQPNLLMGDLEAIFGKDFHQYQYDLNSPEDRLRLGKIFKTCQSPEKL